MYNVTCYAFIQYTVVLYYIIKFIKFKLTVCKHFKNLTITEILDLLIMNSMWKVHNIII